MCVSIGKYLYFSVSKWSEHCWAPLNWHVVVVTPKSWRGFTHGEGPRKKKMWRKRKEVSKEGSTPTRQLLSSQIPTIARSTWSCFMLNSLADFPLWWKLLHAQFFGWFSSLWQNLASWPLTVAGPPPSESFVVGSLWHHSSTENVFPLPIHQRCFLDKFCSNCHYVVEVPFALRNFIVWLMSIFV